jgi:hypothetical protein
VAAADLGTAVLLLTWRQRHVVLLLTCRWTAAWLLGLSNLVPCFYLVYSADNTAAAAAAACSCLLMQTRFCCSGVPNLSCVFCSC